MKKSKYFYLVSFLNNGALHPLSSNYLPADNDTAAGVYHDLARLRAIVG